MQSNTITGVINFIHHEKQYATIEYEQNGKSKTINGLIGENVQKRWKAEKIIKKLHHFRAGDSVSFIAVPGPGGGKMVADCISYLYNNALTNILQKAAYDNKFAGYLKKVDGQYFIKETSNYVVFELVLSPWEKEPRLSSLNEAIFFSVNHFENPEKATASLIRSEFIPAYLHAMDCYKKKKTVEAIVKKISPFGLSVSLFDGTINTKIKVGEKGIDLEKTKEGDTIKIQINYLNPQKIVVELA